MMMFHKPVLNHNSKVLLNKQLLKKQHVDVPHLQKLVLNVIVKCTALVFVMPLANVMQVSVKIK